jgi:hypothetical protein
MSVCGSSSETQSRPVEIYGIGSLQKPAICTVQGPNLIESSPQLYSSNVLPVFEVFQPAFYGHILFPYKTTCYEPKTIYTF